ncbi:lysine--tRNA ligase [bacterium]|nr:lysine--tRNA ligase [bacterium]
MSNKNSVCTGDERHSAKSDEFIVRSEKVESLKAGGISPWPESKPISHTCSDLTAVDVQEGGEATAESFKVAGRVIAKREHGKTIFATIQDRSGTIQLYLKKDVLGDDNFYKLKLFVDLGDFLWVDGPLFITRTGEKTVKVAEWTILSKSLHPLPEKFHGLVDTEQRYRQRYLDLISNSESREKFIQRSKIVRGMRKFLGDKDFLEVETPMLHPIPGGATAKPFVTHHNAYDMDLFLRIAPELYLKRLVVGGLERVFEINRSFRNEGVSTRHNPEFTMLEFYMAHGDYIAGMELTEQLICSIAKTVFFGKTLFEYGTKKISFETPFPRLSVREALVKIGRFNPSGLEPETIDIVLKDNSVELKNSEASYGEKLFTLFEEKVEAKIIQPTFITGYPIEVSPLTKRDPNDETTAPRFELFAAGMELANGYNELNDPFDQADRFRKQAKAKVAGDDEAHHFDKDYVTALEHGLPPTVGVGIGIDRLVMLLTNTASIKDVILFPTMKKKETAEENK